jgi:hypothetical protein
VPSPACVRRLAPLLPCLALGSALSVLSSCATTRLPAPEVRAQLRDVAAYTARLSVSFKGPRGRGRATVLAAFARPDALRIEVPGPGGARLIVVARGDQLTALFPSERAVFHGETTAEDVEAVTGIALTPAEIMDVLVGAPGERVLDPRVVWGARFPRLVKGRLSDGTALQVKMQSVETKAALPALTFAAPAATGYRPIDAEEARNMWVRR